jgi:hypothetical protein
MSQPWHEWYVIRVSTDMILLGETIPPPSLSGAGIQDTHLARRRRGLSLYLVT